MPYRGSAQALPDLVVPVAPVMMFDIIVSALLLIEGGRLKVLSVTGAQPTTRLLRRRRWRRWVIWASRPDQVRTVSSAPAGTPGGHRAPGGGRRARSTESPLMRGQMWQRGAEIQYHSKAAVLAEAVRKDSALPRWLPATGARAE